MATIFLTSSKRKAEEAAIEALYPYRQPPYSANPDRLGRGTKVVCGVVVPDSRTPWQQATDHDYNQERGYFPRVYRVRDYSQCRGEFAQKTEITVPLQLGGGKAARVNGKNGSAASRARVPKRDDVKEAPVLPGKDRTKNPNTEEWKRLRELEKNGETVIIKTPVIPRSDILTVTRVYPLTSHQQMRRALQDAIRQTPPACEWDDKHYIELPFGMKLGRKGGTEIAVWGSYLPKGSKYKVGTKTVVVGRLSGDRFKLYEDTFTFEKALSQIMEIVKEHRLDVPTPPTTPASNEVAA